MLMRFENYYLDLEKVNLPIIVKDCGKEEHGTTITLKGINQNFNYPNPEKLKQILVWDYGRVSDLSIFVNTEKIINMNPDIIVLLAPFLEANIKEQEKIINSWKELPINASKDDNIYAIDKEYAGIPSHRVELFINDFRKILENVRDKRLQ